MVWIGLVSWSLSGELPTTQAERPWSAEGTSRVMGAASCAAASCHGGPRPGVAQPVAKRSNEHTLWLEHDPHAQSWKTFTSSASVAMMQRLKILGPNGAVLDPVGYDNCLACHNSTRRYQVSNQPETHPVDLFADEQTDCLCRQGCPPKTPRATDVNSFRREGVGCSACHGPSERWIGTHFQNGWSPEFASVDGFVNLNDRLTRARQCASCHIGDHDRDMNHDIIAAGHPPLRYEFATYHQRQPKHWRDPDANSDSYEAKLWLTGQIAAADAMLSLLQSRAQRTPWISSHGERPWPELSNFDCASCHHDLGFANARQPFRSGSAGQTQALATISRWNEIGLTWIVLQRIAGGYAVPSDYQLLDSLERLAVAMQSQAEPDSRWIVTLTQSAKDSLDQWIEVVYYGQMATDWTANQLGQLVALAASQGSSYATWETTSQLYLAAVAARVAWPSGPAGPANPIASQLRHGLGYPTDRSISRFARTDRGQRLRRQEATELSVELASWLGTVTPPDLAPYHADNHDLKREQLELRAVIDRVNQTLAESAKAKPKRTPQQPDVQPPKADSPPKPDRPPVKTREQLLEELRKRRSNQLGNPFDDD